MSKNITQKFRAIIIDDETRSRTNLKLLLSKYCPEIVVCGEGKDVISGLEVIKQQQPDVIFLDIEMPNHSGFKLIELLPKNKVPQIIFTTAYEQYAIRALRVAAVDYLLKPIDIYELQSAVKKLKRPRNFFHQRLEVLRSHLNAKAEKIVLPHKEGFVFLQLSEIICLEASRSYTFLHIKNKKKQLVAKPLKEFEDVLPNNIFFRAHRSYIINIQQVEEWIKKDGGHIVMSNNMHIPISKDRRDDFLTFYTALN